MNCSDTIDIVDQNLLRSFSIFGYVMLILFGSLVNAFALWIFCHSLPKWTETTVFLVNLMVADILIVFTFPFRIYVFFHSWDLGDGLCYTMRGAYFVNTYMSIFIITAIALDRYLAICHPMKYKGHMSTKKASIICCFLWILFIIINIIRTIYKNKISETCFWKVNTEPNAMALVYSLAGFLLPLVLVSVCSAKVIKTLSQKEPRNSKGNSNFRKAKNIIISNLVVFVICFLPVHVGYLVRFAVESSGATCHTLSIMQVFIRIATFVSNLNCILDSLCYYFAASEFQDAFSKRIISLLRLPCTS